MQRPRDYAALLVAVQVACSYHPSGAGRAPEPPTDVTRVALVTLDDAGTFIGASALFPRGEAHPFPEPITTQSDGVRQRLVGFSDAQLAGCNDLVDVAPINDALELAPSAVLSIPAPTWAAEGTWSDATIDFQPVDDTTSYTRPGLGIGQDACIAYDISTLRYATTSTDSIQFVLQPADRPPLLFFRNGDVYALDLETYTLTLEWTSVVGHLGGHIDDDGVIWLLRRDGSLGYLDDEARFQHVVGDAPWRKQRRMYMDGVGSGDDLQLWTLTSSAAVHYYTRGVWKELFQAGTVPNLGRIGAGDVHYVRGEGATYVAMDSMPRVYRIEGDTYTATPVGDGPLGPPVAYLESRRYGLIASTKGGGLLRQLGESTWTTVLEADTGRRSPWIFDFDTGLLYGGSNGFFRYWVEGLGNCEFDRIAETSIQDAIVVDDRVIVFEDAEPMNIVVAQLETSRVGCN